MASPGESDARGVPVERHSAASAATHGDVEPVETAQRHPPGPGDTHGDLEPVDRRVAEVARRQHGAISRSQLLACGVTRHGIEHRLRAGRLHPIHRGVYLVGHTAQAPFARESAALLATGPRSALSHRSAAKLHRIVPLDTPGPIDVTVSTQRRPRPGLTVHRSQLAADEVQRRYGLWVTTPGRTLADLRRTADRRTWERAVAEAQILRLVQQEPGGPGPTRSDIERTLVKLLRSARLPAAATNVRVGHFEVDALWRAERLVVEVDSFTFHRTRRAWERDHRKTNALEDAGHRVIRITWGELTEEPLAVVARLARALSCPG